MESIKAYDYSTYNIGIIDILYDINDKVKYITLHNKKVHKAIIRCNIKGESYFNSVHGRIYFKDCLKCNM